VGTASAAGDNGRLGAGQIRSAYGDDDERYGEEEEEEEELGRNQIRRFRR
jgi:hypothetical protein